MAGVRRILCVGVVLEMLLVFEVEGQGEHAISGSLSYVGKIISDVAWLFSEVACSPSIL